MGDGFITDTTAFTLLATSQPHGQGDVLAAVTTTVTVINPDSTYTSLTVNGTTTILGPPQPINYTFTQDYQHTATTDGFLVGWVHDTSPDGSRITAHITHNNTPTRSATASTGKIPWQDVTEPVPDNFFLPVPHNAQLTIHKADPHTSSGTRTCQLRWIPLGNTT